MATPLRVLLTGASGFAGAHLLRHLLMETDWEVVCPVTFRHKGLPARIESSLCHIPGAAERATIIHWDLAAPADPVTLAHLGAVDVVMNVASESHVDRSIAEPGAFIRNNVDLMVNVLEYARWAQPRLVLQMSTDEVYGPAYGDHRHREWETHRPSNPYSASKAAQEAIAFGYWRTYDVPVVLTNTMNLIGEMQDPEKFVPLIIRRLKADEPIEVHCASDGTPGSRHYLHARNLADAWTWLTRYFLEPLAVPTLADPEAVAAPGPSAYSHGAHQPSRYHIVGEREIDNVSLVKMIGELMGVKPKIIRTSFHASRPGHDLRYALDGSKIAEMGWKAPVPFTESLGRTVTWTLEHPEWLA